MCSRYDIWRITEDEVTRTKFSLYNIIKTIYLCINRFTKDRMANKASALTYSTLLAIVPILAILQAVLHNQCRLDCLYFIPFVRLCTV